MGINKLNIDADENVARLSKFPDEYITAVEEIVDNLDSDWRNKLVYGKYIDYLCDVFEEAIAKGLSVDEVIGTDRKAYAEKIQQEQHFMDIEPTKKNKITNFLIILDFVMYVGMTIFALGGKNLSNAQASDFVLIGIGAIIILVCIVIKLIKLKENKNLMFLPMIQLVVSIAVMPLLNYEIIAGALALAFNLISDFVIVAKQKN